LPVNEVVYYYHHDHLGNIRAVTDSNGNVVERHDLYPFGEEITQPTSKDSYLFTGKPRDSESGLDYFGARYYSSSLSRWLSADQIVDIKRNTKNSQKWNLYIYALNNPLRYFDPDGLDEYDRIIATIITQQYTEKYCNFAVRYIVEFGFGYGNEKGQKEILSVINASPNGRANDIYTRLVEESQKKNGLFVEVKEGEAQELANENILVIAAQKNETGSGHVAIVAPLGWLTPVEQANEYAKSKGWTTKGPLIGNIGGEGELNKFLWRNAVFNRSKKVKYFAPRKEWEKYQKNRTNNKNSSSKIKEGGRAQTNDN
jgi:RHS repeat-associated protein